MDYTLVESDGRRKATRVLADTRMPLERFAFLASFDRKLQSLAAMAPEDWNYKYTESKCALPILYSYIHYTFQRVQEENKIAYGEDATQGGKPTRIACFNTGLTTEYFDPIFAAFSESNSEDGDEPFFLRGFFTESQHPLTCFPRRPDPANYFTDPADLIYDRRLSLVRNVEHIVERIERFPTHYRDNPRRLVNAVDIAISRAEQRVIRNYKTAIPQYNRGRIQLLLPLCLDDPAVADVALVIGKEGAVYKGYTVLTLDMAYNNARLLTRPDREWLIP